MSPIELGPCSELFPASAPVAAQAESSVSMSLTAANCRPGRSVDDGSEAASPGLSILESDEDDITTVAGAAFGVWTLKV